MDQRSATEPTSFLPRETKKTDYRSGTAKSKTKGIKLQRSEKRFK